MNKKIFGIIMIASVLGIIIFMNLDRRSEEDKLLDSISWFIYQQTGDFEEYRALELFEITNELLLQDIQLKAQLEVVQDTLKQKASLLNAYGKLPESWQKEVEKFDHILPDQIDEWLQMKVKIDLALSTIDNFQVQPILERESEALDLIDTKFKALNLSVYSIDLSAKESIHYLHRFTLDGKATLSVFELDAQSQEVIAYKEIG